MKYIVEVKYTNPAHEHVSLRRRVDSIKRVVEARSEAEAINRVANQQRSLGFLIKSANIVEQKVEQATSEVISEDRAMSAAIAGGSVGSKILTGKMDPNFGYAANKMPPHLKAAQAKSDVLSKVAKRPQAGTLAAVHRSMEREMLKKEEVEEVDEARKMSRVEWRIGTESEVDKNNKKIFDKLSKTDPVKAQAFHDNLMRMKKKDIKESVEYIEEKLTSADPASKWIHDFVHSDNPKFAGKSKKERINMALGAKYAADRAIKEEAEQVSEAEKKTNEKAYGDTFHKLAKHNPEKAAAYLSHVAKMEEAEQSEKKKLETEKANKPETQDDIKLKLNARIPNKYMRNKHVKIHPPFNIMPDRIKRT